MYEDEENFISDSEKVDQDEDLEDEVIPPKSASTKRPIGKKSKRINDTKEAVLKKALTVLEKTGEKTQIKNQDEDEHDAFGRHIASQLRKMTEKEREFAHFKIQEVIFNMKFSGAQQMMQPSFTAPLGSPLGSPGMNQNIHSSFSGHMPSPVPSPAAHVRTMSTELSGSENIPRNFISYLQSKDL